MPGITASVEMMRTAVERSVGLATALNPHIGCQQASLVAKEALEPAEAWPN